LIHLHYLHHLEQQ